jgi:hypothetical protein
VPWTTRTRVTAAGVALGCGLVGAGGAGVSARACVVGGEHARDECDDGAQTHIHADLVRFRVPAAGSVIPEHIRALGAQGLLEEAIAGVARQGERVPTVHHSRREVWS